eukprot:3773025-Pyramimonas_sp.AAC.1
MDDTTNRNALQTAAVAYDACWCAHPPVLSEWTNQIGERAYTRPSSPSGPIREGRGHIPAG